MRGRLAPAKLASGLADPVGDLAEGGRDIGVGDAFGAEDSAQVHRVDEDDTALPPMLAFLGENLLALGFKGSAGGNQRLVVGVE